MKKKLIMGLVLILLIGSGFTYAHQGSFIPRRWSEDNYDNEVVYSEIFQELDLSSQQETRINEIREKYVGEREHIAEELISKQEEFQNLYQDPEIESTELQALQKEINDLQLELRNIKTDMELEIRDVLTVEQREEIHSYRTEYCPGRNQTMGFRGGHHHSHGGGFSDGLNFWNGRSGMGRRGHHH